MNDAEFQNRLRSMDVRDERPLPDADTIWWRAEFQRRLAAEERAVRPMRIVEQFACAACFVGLVVLVAGRF